MTEANTLTATDTPRTLTISNDVAKMLDDACADRGLSADAVLIMSLAALGRGAGPGGQSRAVGRPRDAEPRPRKAIPNGPQTFEVLGCTLEKTAKTGALALLHVGRDERFMVDASRSAISQIATQHCTKAGIAPIRDTSELTGAHITLICYGGEPFKLTTGERLTE